MPAGKKTLLRFSQEPPLRTCRPFPPHSARSFHFAKTPADPKFLEEKLDPSWKGLAIFSLRPRELFLAVHAAGRPPTSWSLPVPFLFRCFARRLYLTYGLVAAIPARPAFLVRQSRVESSSPFPGKIPFDPFRPDGLSTQRSASSEGASQTAAKEIAENMEKWISLERAEYLFSAAEEELPRAEQPLVSRREKETRRPHRGGSRDRSIKFFRPPRRSSDARGKRPKFWPKKFWKRLPLWGGRRGSEPTMNALLNHQAERVILDARFQASAGYAEVRQPGTGERRAAAPFAPGKSVRPNSRKKSSAAPRRRGSFAFHPEFCPLLKAGELRRC